MGEVGGVDIESMFGVVVPESWSTCGTDGQAEGMSSEIHVVHGSRGNREGDGDVL